MLRDEILSTLAYYDVLDMSLSKEEVFRYLVRKDNKTIPVFSRLRQGSVGQARISECLDALVQEKKVEEKDSRYFLFGRDYLIPLRRKKEQIAKKKWKRAMRIMRVLGMVPFIKIIFVSGSLSLNNTDELSDIDIIIVARHGRIWLTRLLISLVLSLMNARRNHAHTIAPDKICPNHFITDESLRISFQSMYTAQLYANLVPIIVSDKKLLRDFQIANEWIFHYLHHWQMPTPSVSPPFLKGGARPTERSFGRGGRGWSWFEQWAKKLQKRRIERNAAIVHPGGHLTYTDKELAFHAQSSEQHVLMAYENSQSQLTL